ncbi:MULTISPECIES: hypothetical protein [unclassified Bradyrhizobium]|uniref:hypothetical protein n=1 Tax=unclassified Bradyrhizobium TaxID=2631580 RepID=UPI0028EF3A32|nr:MULTISPECIES: hypothetical protein [unclassified Bradyrhizobium]
MSVTSSLYFLRVSGALSRIAVLLCLSGAFLHDAVAKDLTANSVQGCWTLNVDDRPTGARGRKWLVKICLLEGGELSGFVLEPTGEAESIDGVWKMTDRGIELDEEPCTIALEGDGRKMILSSCRYSGRWDLSCRNPIDPFKCLNE